MADDLPAPPGWGYEPKWDGFRVLMWSRSAGPPVPRRPRLDSRNGKPLLRYFPELRAALDQLPAGTVADGEVVVVTDGKLDFDALQNRIHPAREPGTTVSPGRPPPTSLCSTCSPSPVTTCGRVRCASAGSYLEELAGLLGADRGPIADGVTARGARAAGSPWLLSPQTLDVEMARRWFDDFEPAGFDGIVAKGLERPYGEGRREMIKVKHRRTVDCVVGGYRLHKDGTRVGSILLGLYDASRGVALHRPLLVVHREREARDLLAVLAPLAAHVR